MLPPKATKTCTTLSDQLIIMSFTLHIIPGALFTRRVLIYLHEKNLIHSPYLTISPPLSTKPPPTAASNQNSNTIPRAATVPKPKGSLPVLTSPDGTTINSSLAIITFLEDLCDGTQSSPPYSPNSHQESHHQTHGYNVSISGEAQPSMRGSTAEERARHDEIIALVDEATTLFELAARNGSAMFTPLQRQDLGASKMALRGRREVLGKVEELYRENVRLDEGGEPREEQVTVADVVLYTLLEFAQEMYGVDFTKGSDVLGRFFKGFRVRESVGVEGNSDEVWETNLTLLANHWVVETDSTWDWM